MPPDSNLASCSNSAPGATCLARPVAVMASICIMSSIERERLSMTSAT
jgi:hypothetical protein